MVKHLVDASPGSLQSLSSVGDSQDSETFELSPGGEMAKRIAEEESENEKKTK